MLQPPAAATPPGVAAASRSLNPTGTMAPPFAAAATPPGVAAALLASLPPSAATPPGTSASFYSCHVRLDAMHTSE